jgi:hypothetical protein
MMKLLTGFKEKPIKGSNLTPKINKKISFRPIDDQSESPNIKTAQPSLRQSPNSGKKIRFSNPSSRFFLDKVNS